MPNLLVERRENFASRQYDVGKKKVNSVYFYTFLRVILYFMTMILISLFSCFLVATQFSEKYIFADIIFGNEQVCK